MAEPAPIALVTGAGRGIGQAIAERLSRAGLRVALTARSEDELAATAARCPGPALVLPADITSGAAVDEVFAGVERAWGPVAVLVANAGAAFSARLEKTPDSEWQRLLDINLTAPFRCVRRAVPGHAGGRLRADRGHRVQRRPARRAVHRGLRRQQARRARPGPVGRRGAGRHRGDGQRGLPRLRGHADDRGTVRDHRRRAPAAAPSRPARYWTRKQPIGRLITPDEVADAVWFCIGNGALTGQGINVDGGTVQS